MMYGIGCMFPVQVIYHIPYILLPMQELIIFLVFAAAVGYLSNRIYQNFAAKKVGCGKGCGCAVDNKNKPSLFAKRV